MGMENPEAPTVDPLADLPPMLTTSEMATFLGVGESLLAKWRHQRKGPPFTKLTDGDGGAVRYLREDLRTYLAERRVPTAVQ